jgi:hypothetical protein
VTKRIVRWYLRELELDVTPTTPTGALVVLACAAGSDVQEQSDATGISVDRLRASVLDGLDLMPCDSDRLGAWLVCALWRHGFRCGLTDEENGDRASVEVMALRCDPTPAWWADFGDYAAGVQHRRQIEDDARRLRRLTIEEAIDIRDRYERGRTMSQIAEIFAVNVSTVHRCIRGRTNAAKAAEEHKTRG